jgi:phospholipase C
MCNDEHDCDVATGDAWLRAWVPAILDSPAYRRGKTALFITYDEGSRSDNRVYTVVVSPYTKRGTVSTVRFDHYSLLATQEALLGLPCLGHACDPETRSMRAAFGL